MEGKDRGGGGGGGNWGRWWWRVVCSAGKGLVGKVAVGLG